jgi:CspA family cold shock protein
MSKELTSTGVVKFFSESKGFGFIIDDDDSKKEYFFHFSNTLDVIKKDDHVAFELVEGKRGLNAVNVKRVKQDGNNG